MIIFEKILIVYDENEIRKVLTARVEYAGYRVESAENGREAIGAYFESLLMNNEPIPLIILDIIMQGIKFKLKNICLKIFQPGCFSSPIIA